MPSPNQFATGAKWMHLHQNLGNCSKPFPRQMLRLGWQNGPSGDPILQICIDISVTFDILLPNSTTSKQ
jgi:hypothetical protein